jgi:hypothetical protein
MLRNMTYILMLDSDLGGGGQQSVNFIKHQIIVYFIHFRGIRSEKILLRRRGMDKGFDMLIK